MDEKEQRMDQMQDQIKELPEKVQNAIYWLRENIYIADQLTRGEKLTEQEIKAITNDALEKEDYLMLVLTLYKQAKDKKENCV